MKRHILSLIILLLPFITLGMENQKRKFLQKQDLEFEDITHELNKRYHEINSKAHNPGYQENCTHEAKSYQEPIEFVTYTDEYARKWKKLKQLFCCCMTNEEK